MGVAFLDRLYDSVYDYLGDPSTTRRLSKSKILSDFNSVEREITNYLLRIGGRESSINRAEADITLQSGVAFYQFPVAFRNLIRLERRTDGDRNKIEAILRTIPEHHRARTGVVVLSADRGFEIRPTPNLAADETWTLMYQKGPILIHHGTAQAVGDNTLTLATSPDSDGGEIVALDDYYNGSMIHVYSATAGAYQTAEVTDFVASTKVCTLRHDWAVNPTGTIKYEIRPVVPTEYDDVYALRVAMINCGRREQARRWNHLRSEFEARMEGLRSWVMSNASDQPSERVVADLNSDIDPYDGMC